MVAVHPPWRRRFPLLQVASFIGGALLPTEGLPPASRPTVEAEDVARSGARSEAGRDASPGSSRTQDRRSCHEAATAADAAHSSFF
jgi:hypothetical protein